MGAFALTLPLAVLFIARAIDGITGGNVSVADAYVFAILNGGYFIGTIVVADISSDENRGKNYGKMAISSNLGFIVGPALAGILGATIYGEILPVSAALILSSIVLVVIVFILKESKPSILMEIPEKNNVGKVF